jgi:hypothetical protein
VKLPPGWKVAFVRASPEDHLSMVSDGVIALRAESPAGRYVKVWFACPGTELGGDYLWTLEPDASGRGVKGVRERPVCGFKDRNACMEDVKRPDSELTEEDCRVRCGFGDGNLGITAIFAGATPYRGHDVCVDLGDPSADDGPRDDLRSIAMSLRVEGPTGLPEPTFPRPTDPATPRK